MCMIVEGYNSCCFLKQKTNFANCPFFFPLAGREIPISKKKRKKVTHSFSKLYSVADLNLNVDSKIIATPGCDLKALGNFSSLSTGRHSQWLEQGLHGGGTARTTQSQKDSQGWTLLWESFLFGPWVTVAPHTFSRVALAIAPTSYTSEGRDGTHPPPLLFVSFINHKIQGCDLRMGCCAFPTRTVPPGSQLSVEISHNHQLCIFW